jgi:hypothetical protein
VDTAAIQSKAVTAAKIADDTITAAQIAANAVGSSELADNAVDTNAIQDGAVTPAKLATSGRFLFPAADGWGFTGGAVTLQGTAAPEGAVSAALGSTYLQTSGAATVTGMMSWRKTTGGTGATGWSPEGALADTGWRDVTSALLNSHTAAEFKIRRIGQTVHLRVSDATGTTAADIYTLATGWRTNSAGSRFYVQRINSGSVYAGRLYRADGGGTTVSLNTLAGTPAKAAGDTWNATLTWATNDGWPASLPGSATT